MGKMISGTAYKFIEEFEKAVIENGPQIGKKDHTGALANLAGYIHYLEAAVSPAIALHNRQNAYLPSYELLEYFAKEKGNNLTAVMNVLKATNSNFLDL